MGTFSGRTTELSHQAAKATEAAAEKKIAEGAAEAEAKTAAKATAKAAEKPVNPIGKIEEGEIDRAGSASDRLNARNAAVDVETAQVVKNKAAGDAFRDQIAEGLRKEGRDVATEVYKKTPFGKRFIDIEVSKDGKILGGIETKVGSSRYTPLQRLKDTYLRIVNDYSVTVVRNR